MNFIDSYLDQSSQVKLMTKAFGIKNFKWATCSKLINRHKILLDMKQGELAQKLVLKFTGIIFTVKMPAFHV